MKIHKSLLLLIFNIITINFFSQSLVINEVSQGPSGNKEYVELVVVWNPTCVTNKPCVDLRGYIIDDNNGRFAGGSGVGIAAGCVRFTNNQLWSCVPVGTIIVIYNDLDRNLSIPPNDLSLTDGNCRLIIPISDCNLFEKNITNPSTTSATFPTASFTTCGNWTQVSMANGGDSFQVIDANGNLLHSVSWGNNNTNNIIYLGNISVSAQVASFTNNLSNNPNLNSNWTLSTVANNETPGLPNNVNNENWINTLSFNCGEITPLIINETITNSSCSCDGSINLNASGSLPPYNYTWSNTNSNVSNQNNLCPDTYTLTVASSIGCTETKTISIIQTGSSNISVSAGQDQNICQTSTNVTASSLNSGQTGSWSIVSGSATFGSSSNSSTSITDLSTGINILKWEVTDLCGTAYATVNITVNPIPILTLATSANICSGEQLNIPITSSINSSTFTWQTSNNINTSGESVNVQISNTINDIITNNSNNSQSLTYTVIANAGQCSSIPKEVSVTVNSLPNVSISPASTITCSSPNVTLTGNSTTNGVIFSWNPGGTTPNSSSTNVSSAGNYVLTVTNTVTSCTNSDNITVTTNTTLPNISVGSNPIITCIDTLVTITGSSSSSGVLYSWSPGGITPNNNTTQVNTIGIYELTVTDPFNGCYSTATVNVTSNLSQPDIILSNNQIITCSNSSVNLTGNSSVANAIYFWSNGSLNQNSSTIIVNTTGIYTLTVTNPANGCTNNGFINVTSNLTLPSASAGNDQSLTCSINEVNLTGSSTSSNVSYLWNPPGMTPTSATNIVSTTGFYTLTVTDNINGCTSTDIVEVITDTNQPQLTMVSNQQLTCLVTSVNIGGTTTTNNVNFTWDASVINSIGSSATVSNPGDYTLTVTNTTNGCSNSGVVSVSIDTISPNVDAGLNQTLTCTVSTVALSGNSSTPGATYLWSPAGDTPTTSSTNVAAIGIYTLTVTNPINGCSSSDIVQVLPDANLPSINMGQNQTLNCSNSSVSITGQTNTSNASYTWNPPGTTPSNFSTEVTATGIYTLTVTDLSNGCSSSSTISVTSDLTIPAANIDPVPPITCSSSSSSVSASSDVSNATYSWSGPNNFNSNQANNNITAAGLYTLIVTHPVSTCTATAFVNVLIDTISPSILATSNASTLTCAQEFTDLIGSSSTSGVSYQWNGVNGVISGNPVMINSPGTYTLTVSNPVNGCISLSTVVINQNIIQPQAQATISNPVLNCEITDAYLNASGSSNFNYIWTGPNTFTSVQQNPAQSINTIGTYTLYVIDPTNGCTDSSFVSLAQGPNPVADFTFDPSVGYMPLSINFTNQSSVGFTNGYSWSFGDGKTSIEINPNNIYTSSGTFTITLIGYGNVGACNDTVEKIIIVYPEIKLEIPNVFSPNDDGINDIFFILSSGFKELSISIFNRWGNLITTYNTLKDNWKGINYNGEKCSEGTYYYILNGVKINNEQYNNTGYILLVR